LVGFLGEIGKAARQFVSVDLPVTQPGIVVIARVPVAEPTVIEQERFRAQFLRAVK